MSGGTIHALVPAAGSSLRFGAQRPKQYMLLQGRPLLAHSIDAVQRHPRVTATHVVLAPEDVLFNKLLAAEFNEVQCVTGGASRAESVLNGLRHIAGFDPRCEWVLVHDAARPCLSRQSLERLINEAPLSTDGGILAVPVVDTLKRGSAGQIQETVDRSALWAAQTPQMFPLDALMSALADMMATGMAPTDEAGAMEHAGYAPRLVEGDRTNIKVTHAADLALADFILSRQQESNS